jgi:hypothetical protein
MDSEGLLDANGTPANLVGKRCEALLCQEYWYDDKLVEAANAVCLCADGCWYRLYFDCGIIFWRAEGGPLESLEAVEIKGSYQVIDLATSRGFRGRRIIGCEMKPIDYGSQVVLSFEGGTQLVFRNLDNITTYGG